MAGRNPTPHSQGPGLPHVQRPPIDIRNGGALVRQAIQPKLSASARPGPPVAAFAGKVLQPAMARGPVAPVRPPINLAHGGGRAVQRSSSEQDALAALLGLSGSSSSSSSASTTSSSSSSSASSSATVHQTSVSTVTTPSQIPSAHSAFAPPQSGYRNLQIGKVIIRASTVLVDLLYALAKEERLPALLGQLTKDRIEIVYEEGETSTQGSRIRIGKGLSNRQAITDALYVELGNMAKQSSMLGPQMMNLFHAAELVETYGSAAVPKELQQKSLERAAAVAINNELVEMANCLEGYLKGDKTFAKLFESIGAPKGPLNAIEWIKVQIQAGHTAKYDKAASSQSWSGYNLLDKFSKELAAVPCGANGGELLRKIGAAITKSCGL